MIDLMNAIVADRRGDIFPGEDHDRQTPAQESKFASTNNNTGFDQQNMTGMRRTGVLRKSIMQTT